MDKAVFGPHIALQARSWLGTRFHHQGRLKRQELGAHRGGVDCLGLLIGVAGELGLPFWDKEAGRFISVRELDTPHYGHMPDVHLLEAKLTRYLTPISASDAQEGDIALLRVDGRAQHLGVLGSYERQLTLIHAFAPARAVIEHRLDESWRERVVGIFRFALYSVNPERG